MGDITQLLAHAREGDRDAFDALFQALYPDLRRIARARLAPHKRGTLVDTSALVHEVYPKFDQATRLTPAGRAHFLAYAARVMRSIGEDQVVGRHRPHRATRLGEGSCWPRTCASDEARPTGIAARRRGTGDVRFLPRDPY